MDAQATLLSLAASTTLRQGAFLLRSDPTLPAKEPSLLPALTLAAQDLIRSYLASSPTFPPKHTPFAPPASQPSTSTSLAAYLTSLPEDEVTLPAPPSSSASTPPNATSVSKDASLHQIKRDVERDSFTVNGGPLIKGSESTFTGVVSTLVESIRSTLRTSYPQEPPPPLFDDTATLTALCTEVLRRGNRTASGGDAFDAARGVLGLGGEGGGGVGSEGSQRLPLLLMANSKLARPVELGFSMGGFHAPPSSSCLNAAAGDARVLAPHLPPSPHLAQSFSWVEALHYGLLVTIKATTHYTLMHEGKEGEPLPVADITATFTARFAVAAPPALIPTSPPSIRIAIEPVV